MSLLPDEKPPTREPAARAEARPKVVATAPPKASRPPSSPRPAAAPQPRDKVKVAGHADDVLEAVKALE